MWLLKGLFLFVALSISGLLILVSFILLLLQGKDKRKKKIWLTVFAASCIISILLSTYAAIKVTEKVIDETTAFIRSKDNEVHTGGFKTYRYWAESDPGPETKVLNGQYKSFSHFSKEYVLYLELESEWVKDFARENNLERVLTNPNLPDDAPEWFNPPKKYDVWKGSQGSTYFINPQTGHIFIYEVQL